MANDKDDKDFKVVDKRGQDRGDRKKESSGEGFTMKEAPQEATNAPHQLDFATLVLSFATSSLMNMGLTADPQTKKVEKNLPLAQQNIDILRILRDKSKGNLTQDENDLIENILKEVQLRFVEASRSK